MGINPAGSSIQGHSVDGVLPDDQRRAGSFTWPPPKENYVHEALQGAVTCAVILHNAGYDVFDWCDQALLRAVTWSRDVCNFPFQGDDTWMAPLVDAAYGTSFWNGRATDFGSPGVFTGQGPDGLTRGGMASGATWEMMITCGLNAFLFGDHFRLTLTGTHVNRSNTAMRDDFILSLQAAALI